MDKACHLCGSESKKSTYQGGFGDYYYCTYCGKYIIDSELKTEYKENYLFRGALFYYIHNRTRERTKIVYVTKHNVTDRQYIVVTYEEIMKLAPQNITDLVAKIMINLSVVEPNYGTTINLSGSELYRTIFYSGNNIQATMNIESIVHMLEDLNYIRIQDEDHYSFNISYEGWKFIEEYKTTLEKSKKAFIAMSFAENTIDTRNTLQDAIRECGYFPMIIDEKEHNRQIVPEILFEIDSSDFVVADLTNHRAGVYYEAGYALGRKKEVILTIHNDDVENIHFDVNQTNQIRYSSQDDLFMKLVKRIKATITEV